MPCISLKRILSIVAFLGALAIEAAPPPNVILVMTDDQGYGQTGYYDHPLLETPNLDKMAENGLRFDRFYAGSSVCSPTRASVLTGRTPHRSGVPDHGYALRHQEKTLPQALKNAGYTTGFFGKWHLNGLRGPGVPITEDDPYSPGTFGFEDWLAVTNFFDIDPVMSKNGEWTEYTGITSDIIVDAAMTFIVESTQANQPFFAVIWDGSPHDPFVATEEDRAPFIPHMNEKAANHLGEIVAFDRSLGRLREFLREQNLSENTILWYCSDNGGLKGSFGDTVKGLRGMKGTPFEGGLRVPAIVEWPGTIEPRITQFNASTMDIFPTLVDVIGLPESSMTEPQDGISIAPLFFDELPPRETPIGFMRFKDKAFLDQNLKLIQRKQDEGGYQLYDLSTDPYEKNDIAGTSPERLAIIQAAFEAWEASVLASERGEDYPEGQVADSHNAEPHFWWEDERYIPHFDWFLEREEYKQRLTKFLETGKHW